MGGIIGIGTFFTPSSVAARAGDAGTVLGLWTFGGALALCAALVFAELGAAYPRAGGWFVFLKEAFGGFPAFLFAWVVLFVVSTGAMAAILGFAADTAHDLLPDLVGARGSTGHGVVAMGLLALLTGVALTGVRPAALFQNLCMLIKLLVLLALAGVALSLAGDDGGAAAALRDAADAAAGQVGAGGGAGSGASTGNAAAPTGWVTALLPVLFSFGGWQLICYIAPEVENPGATLPRAIVLGVLGVLGVYLLTNVAVLQALGLAGLAGDMGFATTIAERAAGPVGKQVLGVGMFISAVGVCAVNVITAPWLYVAMARERLFLATVGRVRAGTGVPANALLLQAALVAVYFHAQTLQQLVDSVIFAEWIFHGLAAWALLRLRRTQPDRHRPFRCPAHPWPAVIYGVAALCVVLGVLWQAEWSVSLTGLGVVAAGALVYRPWRAAFARA